MLRTQTQIVLGILFTLIAGTVLLFYALDEDERMAAYAQSQRAQAIEVGAELFGSICKDCHGPQGLGTALCPPLNDRNFFDNRMKEVGWVGTLEDYIVATASSGRLVSTQIGRASCRERV